MKPRPQLRLRATALAEKQIRGGHPWLYETGIKEQNRPGETGELGVVYDRNDRFLAIGLYDADSPIRLRVLHRGKPQPIDAAWWSAQLERSLERRQSLFDNLTTGFRWIHGESDGWPGLVLDRYGETLVLKLYTGAWFPFLERIQALISKRLAPERIVLRLSRNIQERARAMYQFNDGMIIHGSAVEDSVRFLETGLQLRADVVKGQKTGFFLDQRENRRRVEGISKNQRVLNVFSFSGGFSLYAARGGAKSVTDVDISAHALEAAGENFRLNQSSASVAACPHAMVKADAFEFLGSETAGSFDLIILDPPSMAKRKEEKAGALRAYGRLTELALGHLATNGILVACSCSAHVSTDEFFAAVRNTAGKSKRAWTELLTTGHPPDHPASFPEASYLKAIYLRFETT